MNSCPGAGREFINTHRSRGRHVRRDPPEHRCLPTLPSFGPAVSGSKRQYPRVQAAYANYKTPKFIAFLTLRPDGGVEDDFLAAKFATPVGTAWAVSSV